MADARTCEMGATLVIITFKCWSNLFYWQCLIKSSAHWHYPKTAHKLFLSHPSQFTSTLPYHVTNSMHDTVSLNRSKPPRLPNNGII